MPGDAKVVFIPQRQPRQQQNLKQSNYELVEINPQQLQRNRFQPRSVFKEEEIAELAESIRQAGLLQPPLVAQYISQEGTILYEIIAGERRVQACKMLGMQQIPVYLVDMQDEMRSQAALIENVQRVDLSAIEIAEALARLQQQFFLSQEQLAKKIGKKRSTISNYLRLLQLPPQIQAAIREKTITLAHAKVLLSCKTEVEQLHLFKKLLQEPLSVRKCSKLLENKNQFLRELEGRLIRHLNTTVSVSDRGGKGTITIQFSSYDLLDEILSNMGFVSYES